MMQVTQAESGSLGVAYFCFIEAARKHNIDTGASRLRRPGFSEFADAHPAKSGGTKALHIPDAKPFVCVHTSTRMYLSTPTPEPQTRSGVRLVFISCGDEWLHST